MELINSGVFDITDAACVRFVENYASKRKFISDFKHNFNTIRVYHGTNLSEEESADILKTGLRKTTISFLKNKAMQRFITKDDSIEVKAMISEIIADYFEKEKPVTLGEVNFSTDEQLVYEHYHYLLFGSETLLNVANNLKKMLNLPFRNRMMDFGKHTIVIANLPTKKVGNLWLQCIYEYINEGFPESSIVVKTTIRPEHIIELKMVDRPYDKRGVVYM